ncbi:MAG: transglutaminase domain-containing protein [Candidatus Peribacteraceae bacterium]|nr:transglutaminase domain-containing protein [Candidatus Peribacteraceae bacterium]
MKSNVIMASVFFLIVFLVNSQYVSSAVDEVLSNPAGVDELTVNIHHYGSIDMDGNPTKIMINLSVPQDDSRQDVELNMETVTNELGTVVGTVNADDPDNHFTYDILSTVRSRASHLYSLPKSYVIPDDVEVYLQSTKNIQSSDPKFQELAEEITSGSKDDFEKIAKLAMWVYDHLDYDLSYSGKNFDALTVLESKIGVCAEYTTLFIALARSIGIPAKFVSGWSYGDMGWERHAYSEVYLGEWVPVDPLWLEIGYMDATHLRFGDHVDNTVRNNVEVTGFNVKNIVWSKDDIELEIVSHSQIEKEAEYEMTISSEEFRKGDDGVVILSIVPKEYIVGKVVLQTCSGNYDIVDVIDKEKRVILRPGEKEQIYWKIKINDDLPSNYMFTCPLTLNSRSLALKQVDTSVNSRYGERFTNKLTASLSSETIELGEEQIVFISTSDMVPDSYIGMVAGDDHKRYDGVSGDFMTTFTFTPDQLGENEVIIYTSEGETKTLKYNVESDLAISIDDFDAPKYLKIGDTKNVSAYIVNKGTNEESIHVNMIVDGENNLANFIIKNKYLVSVPVSFNTPGAKIVKIEVSASGTDYSESRVIEAYEEPVIHYDIDYLEGNGIVKLNVKNSKIKDVEVKVSGVSKTVSEIFGEHEIKFPLPTGNYEMVLTCKDIAGKPYEVSEIVEFKERDIFAHITSALNGFIEYIMSFFS